MPSFGSLRLTVESAKGTLQQPLDMYAARVSLRSHAPKICPHSVIPWGPSRVASLVLKDIQALSLHYRPGGTAGTKGSKTLLLPCVARIPGVDRHCSSMLAPISAMRLGNLLMLNPTGHPAANVCTTTACGRPSTSSKKRGHEGGHLLGGVRLSPGGGENEDSSS